jgi:rhodanese-related sulfurtransferase
VVEYLRVFYHVGFFVSAWRAQPRFEQQQEISMNIAVIKPQELSKLCKEGNKVDLIDVRTPVEFREVHLEIARNVPLDQLDPASLMHARNGSANEPLYFICRSGSRGQQACEKSLKAGFSNVVNIEGGTMACVEAGLPVVHGKKAMSLERQVRIAAGSLVLLGAILGWLVHPAFIGLSAFVGAGLVFAGITGSCGISMILARMPWNQWSQPQPPVAPADGSPRDYQGSPRS